MATRNSILVHNLPVLEGLSLSDKLQIYFGKRSNGGGDIDDVQLEKPNGHPTTAALITFAEEETVRSVLMKEHDFFGKRLRIEPYRPLIEELQTQESERTSNVPENLNVLSGLNPQQNVKLVLNGPCSAAHLESVEAETSAMFGIDEKTARFTLTGPAHEVMQAASMLAISRSGGMEGCLPMEDIERDDEQGSRSWSPHTLTIKNLHLADRAVQEHGVATPKIKSIEHQQKESEFGPTKITQQARRTMETPTTSKLSQKLRDCSPGKSAKQPRNSVRFEQKVLDYMNLNVANHRKIDEIQDKFKVDFQSKPGGAVEVSSRGQETNPQNIQRAIEALEDLVNQTKQLDFVTEIVDIESQFPESSSETWDSAAQQAQKSTQVLVTRRAHNRLEFFGRARDVHEAITKLHDSVLNLAPPDGPDAVHSMVLDRDTAGRNLSRRNQESLSQPAEKDGEAINGDRVSSPSGEQRVGLGACEVMQAASMVASSRSGGMEGCLPMEDIERDYEQGSQSWSPHTLTIKNLHLVDRVAQELGVATPKIKSIEHQQKGDKSGPTKVTQQTSRSMETLTTCKRSQKLTNCGPRKSTKRPRNSIRFERKVLDYMHLHAANHRKIDEIRDKFKVDFQPKPGGAVEVSSRGQETNPQNIQWAIEALEDLVNQTEQLDLVTEVVNVARQFPEASSETLDSAAQQAQKSTQVLVTRRAFNRLEFFGTHHEVHQEIAKLQESVLAMEPADEPDAVHSLIRDKDGAERNRFRQNQKSLSQPTEKDGETLNEDVTFSPPLGEQRVGLAASVPNKTGYLAEGACSSTFGAPVGLEAQYLPPCGPESCSACSFGAGDVIDGGTVGRVEIPMETSLSTDLDCNIPPDWHQTGTVDLRSHVDDGGEDNDDDEDGNENKCDDVLPFQTSPYEDLVETPEAPTISNSVAEPVIPSSDDQPSTLESLAPQVSFVYIHPDADPDRVNATVHEDPKDIRIEAQNELAENVPSASANWAGYPCEEIENQIPRGLSSAESEVPLVTDIWEDEVYAIETSHQFPMPPASGGASYQHHESASGGDYSITLKTGMKLVIRQGDLTDEFTSVIISSADPHLRLQDGVGRAVREAAGPELVSACQSWVQKHGPVECGKSVWTTGGNLMCSHVLHVVLPGSGVQMEMLTETIVEALKTCTHKLEASMVSMPAIGVGRGASRTACAHAFCDAMLQITQLYQQGWLRLETLVLVDQNEATVAEFRQVFNDAILNGFLQELVMWDGEERRTDADQATWAAERADNAYNEMASAAAPWRCSPSSGAIPRLRPKGPSWLVQKPHQKPKPAKVECKQDNQCSICLGEIRKEKKLKCGHRFCRKCIDTWLRDHDTCPYCKRKV